MVSLYDMLCPTVLIKETNISQLDHLDHLGHTGPLMGPTIRHAKNTWFSLYLPPFSAFILSRNQCRTLKPMDKLLFGAEEFISTRGF